MGKMTFVVEFEDGKEPPVSAADEFMGGRLVAAALYDYRDGFFTEEQKKLLPKCWRSPSGMIMLSRRKQKQL